MDMLTTETEGGKHITADPYLVFVAEFKGICRMDVQLLAAFWTVSILFVITPGIDWAYAISAGIKGQPHVVPAVSGLLLGHSLAIVLVAAGMGALITHYPVVQLLLTVLGAFYLMWIGITTFCHPATPQSRSDVLTETPRNWLLNGIGVSGLNPKVFLLYLALLPKFVDSSLSWPVAMQMAVLGMLPIGSAMVVYLLVGFGARSLLSTRPQAAQRVSQCSGIIMLGIAVLLLADVFL